MKIVTIIGTRPQFIKAAVVSRVLRQTHLEILINTGQHYDVNMSDIFFEEMLIPCPDYNLNVGSSSHAKQTAEMMVGIEEILLKEKPDYALVYGDTNSTLAGALAASKILVPIIHIEAGVRSFNMTMPEEQNRILTDRISKYLFCPTETAVNNLKNEGIIRGVYNVGDVMIDAVLYYSKKLDDFQHKYFFERLNGIYKKVSILKKWYTTTIHRVENTDNLDKMKEILSALEEFDAPVIFPVHPRTAHIVEQLENLYGYKNILFVRPISYLDMLFFTKNAIKIITDSGGLQKEAYILDTPCITVRKQTEWIETLKEGANILANPQKDDIIHKAFNLRINCKKRDYYGKGNASQQIVNIINSV